MEELEGQEHKFKPWQTSAPHIIYVALGVFIVVFGIFSLFIKERLYLGEAPISLLFGFVIGPVAAKIVNPAKWGNNSGYTPGTETTNEVTLEVMRVCIALSVFSVGVELPKKYVWRHWRTIAMLLGPVMFWGWMVSSLLIWALIPGLDFLAAMMIGACVSPTDPILAQAVVGGPWAEKHVPSHIRYMLQCESGCNDGAAFPFMFIAYFLTVNRGEVGFPVGKFFYQTMAWEVCLGTAIGAVIGFVARKLIRFSESRKLVDRESFVAQYVSLAMASLGINVLLGSDDLLAAFACGTAFAWDGWFTKQTEDSNFSSIVDLLFNIATFVYIGSIMPWHTFNDDSVNLQAWRLVVLTVCILLVKRVPVVVLLWKFIPDIKTFREALFTGHFGPMGVGAIFMCTYGRLLLPQHPAHPPETPNDVLALTIQPIVFFFVLSSTIVHGFTVPFFAMGRRAHTGLSRTFTTQTTYVNTGDEPAWMSRVRRVPEDGNLEIGPETEKEEEAAEPSAEAEARLEEQALEEGEATPAGQETEFDELDERQNILGRWKKRQPDLEEGLTSSQIKGGDDEDEHLNASGDEEYGGEETAEMKRMQSSQSTAGEVAGQREEDITDHKPYEHGLGGDVHPSVQEEREHEYPKVRQFVEGHHLVIERQEHELAEPETEVIKLSDREYKELASQENPVSAWIHLNAEGIREHIMGTDDKNSDTQSLSSKMDFTTLWKHGIFGKYRSNMELPESVNNLVENLDKERSGRGRQAADQDKGKHGIVMVGGRPSDQHAGIAPEPSSGQTPDVHKSSILANPGDKRRTTPHIANKSDEQKPRRRSRVGFMTRSEQPMREKLLGGIFGRGKRDDKDPGHIETPKDVTQEDQRATVVEPAGAPRSAADVDEPEEEEEEDAEPDDPADLDDQDPRPSHDATGDQMTSDQSEHTENHPVASGAETAAAPIVGAAWNNATLGNR